MTRSPLLIAAAAGGAALAMAATATATPPHATASCPTPGQPTLGIGLHGQPQGSTITKPITVTDAAGIRLVEQVGRWTAGAIVTVPLPSLPSPSTVTVRVGGERPLSVVVECAPLAPPPPLPAPDLPPSAPPAPPVEVPRDWTPTCAALIAQYPGAGPARRAAWGCPARAVSVTPQRSTPRRITCAYLRRVGAGPRWYAARGWYYRCAPGPRSRPAIPAVAGEYRR